MAGDGEGPVSGYETPEYQEARFLREAEWQRANRMDLWSHAAYPGRSFPRGTATALQCERDLAAARLGMGILREPDETGARALAAMESMAASLKAIVKALDSLGARLADHD